MGITLSGGMNFSGGMTVGAGSGPPPPPPETYGSVALNGTNQYLTVPKDLAFDFVTGDFTVEAWVNLNSATQPAYSAIYAYRGPSYQGTPLLVDFGADGASIRVTIQGLSTTFGAHGQSANTWWHLAVVRTSGSVLVFINGVQLGSSTSMTGVITQEPDYAVYLGTNPAAGGTTYIMGGKLSNIRVVKGVAVYTANFAPPTTNLAATQSANANGNPSAAVTGTQTSLLLDMKTSGTLLTDGSTYAFTVTNNNTATWSASTPYPLPACGSLSFNGSGQYLQVPDNSALAFGTGDFTVELWVNPVLLNNNAAPGIIDLATGTGGRGSLFLYNNLVTWLSGGTTFAIVGSTLSLNTWAHIAVARASGQTKMFINGVQAGSTFADSTSYASGTNYIGVQASSAYGFEGGITNVRFVKGTAVYTSNFTPPTAPLTAVSGTQLLLDATNAKNAVTDGSTNNFTVTNNGNIVWSPSNPY